MIQKLWHAFKFSRMEPRLCGATFFATDTAGKSFWGILLQSFHDINPYFSRINFPRYLVVYLSSLWIYDSGKEALSILKKKKQK